ncbi:MAG: SPW repeat protein [Bacteroidia bacterium]|nr:SPW repeat protein [Bacteroidia bacterium]
MTKIIGPLVSTFAVICWWEATRGVRWWNVPLGVWLLFAPWILAYDSTAAIANDMLCGAVIVALSLVKVEVSQNFGGGWRSLGSKNPRHLQIMEENGQNK